MKRLIAVSAAVALLAWPSVAWAWGNEGHEIIALIAASRLSPDAKMQVETLLGGNSSEVMLAASTWADKIRRNRPLTAPWHYVDIEITSADYAPGDCRSDDCVVAQVKKDLAIVGDTAISVPIRAEALRFLIHFVGDLHQPLHAADNHDRGGNEVQVLFMGRRKNLHAVWDTDVVKSLGSDPAAVAATLEKEITPGQTERWSQGSVVDWTNQSFRIAKDDIYPLLRDTGGTDAPIILPNDYAKRSSMIVRTQLERAGVRLAILLNRALKPN